MAADALPQLDSHARRSLSAAVLTPSGRGAVATISIQCLADRDVGTIDRHFSAANGRKLARQPTDRICFGRWSSAASVDPESVDSEEVVVVRREDGAIEVCCHGGPTAVERILDDLRKRDIPTVSWQEHLAGNTTGLEAELQSALVRATTRRSALRLLEQQSVQPVEFARFQQLGRSVGDGGAKVESSPLAATLSAELEEILQWSSFGLHLTTPWRIVLAGRPNVGKSTLMNALAGFDRAIVYDEPGTTRDVVSVETALDGWPILLLDTAGIRDTTNEIEREGVSRSRRALDEADCVCLLLDSGSPLTDDDRQLMADVAASSTPAILVASKSDLEGAWESSSDEAISVSATTGAGVDRLLKAIVKLVVPEEPPAGMVLPVTARQVALLTAASEAADAGELDVAARLLEEMNHGKDGKHGKE